MTNTKKALLTGVAALALAAAVHPTAVLKSASSSAEAGAEIKLLGEEFVPDEATMLVLRGPLAEYELRDVTPDADGKFQIDLAIPGNVRPGQYRVVALAADGDVSASLDITIMAASPASHEDGEDEGHDEMADMSGARSDEMPIERSRSGMGWGIIGLFVGLAGGGGATLIARS